jgi:hypothetical protein
MIEFALIGLVVTLVLVMVYARRTRSKWPSDLKRLHPGVANKAEWMAPDDVLHAVQADYLHAQRWIAETMLAGYAKFTDEAPRYFTGSYLKRQQKLAALHLKSNPRGQRYIGVLRCEHKIRIRHFSDDGLECYLLDRQMNRAIVTYDYPCLNPISTQALDQGAYVYRMIFDRKERHWKIEDFVQQLPLGWEEQVISNDSIRLDESLPAAAGRDL